MDVGRLSNNGAQHRCQTNIHNFRVITCVQNTAYCLNNAFKYYTIKKNPRCFCSGYCTCKF